MSDFLVVFCGFILLSLLLLIGGRLETYKFPFAPIQYSISVNNFEELKVQIEKELLNNYFKKETEKHYEDMGTVYGYTMKAFMQHKDFYLINMNMQISKDDDKAIKKFEREILATYTPFFRRASSANNIFIYCFDYISEDIVASITPGWSFYAGYRSTGMFDFPLFVSFYTKTAYSLNFNNERPTMISHSWDKHFELISSVFEQKV